MQLPLQINFRNLQPSASVERHIRQRAAALERTTPRITGCRVTIDESGGHRAKGKLYHIRVDLTVPGAEIVVTRNPPDHAHESLLVAVRDAFDAVRRRLEDHGRRVRGEVKTHEAPPHGRVASLNREAGYGFIRGADGEEVYMHRNSVVADRFDALEIGDEVRYAVHPGEGEKGPQASMVAPIGKHHLDPPVQ